MHQLHQKQIIKEIENIQKNFHWNCTTPKIKHKTLCNSFAAGGLRNNDVNTEIASFECPWIKRLYDDSFHERKLISNANITPPFKFHPSF